MGNQLKKIIINSDSSVVTVSAGEPILDPQAKWEYGTAEQMINLKFNQQDYKVNTKIEEQDNQIYAEDQKINLIRSEVQAAQLAIGAVQTDSVPIQNSTNHLTSGAIYNTIKLPELGFVDDKLRNNSSNLITSKAVIDFFTFESRENIDYYNGLLIWSDGYYNNTGYHESTDFKHTNILPKNLLSYYDINYSATGVIQTNLYKDSIYVGIINKNGYIVNGEVVDEDSVDYDSWLLNVSIPGRESTYQNLCVAKKTISSIVNDLVSINDEFKSSEVENIKRSDLLLNDELQWLNAYYRPNDGKIIADERLFKSTLKLPISLYNIITSFDYLTANDYVYFWSDEEYLGYYLNNTYYNKDGEVVENISNFNIFSLSIRIINSINHRQFHIDPLYTTEGLKYITETLLDGNLEWLYGYYEYTTGIYRELTEDGIYACTPIFSGDISLFSPVEIKNECFFSLWNNGTYVGSLRKNNIFYDKDENVVNNLTYNRFAYNVYKRNDPNYLTYRIIQKDLKNIVNYDLNPNNLNLINFVTGYYAYVEDGALAFTTIRAMGYRIYSILPGSKLRIKNTGSLYSYLAVLCNEDGSNATLIQREGGDYIVPEGNTKLYVNVGLNSDLSNIIIQVKIATGEFVDIPPAINIINAALSEVTRQNNKIDTDFYALGDSITCGAYADDVSYADYISQTILFNHFYKYAISGSTAHINIDHPTSTLQKQIERIQEGVTGITTIMMGTNDVAVYGKYAGTEQATVIGNVNETMAKNFEDLDYTTTFSDSYRLNLETLQRKCPNMTIVVLVPLKMRITSGYPYSDDSICEQFREIEKGICKHMGIPYVNTNLICGINPYCNWSTFMRDGVHPYPAGQKKIAQVLTGVLLNYCRQINENQ